MNFLQKNKHLLIFLYFPIYMFWFNYLEKTITTDFNIIHTSIDDIIPFNEYFIIPYLLWFIYISVFFFYFLLNDLNTFNKFNICLVIGLTISLIIYTIFPNGTDLRPIINPNKNFATTIIYNLYKYDTPTNIFPSIHVYNSLITHLAIIKSKPLSKNKFICNLSLIITLLICLSTVMLKQHSILDMVASFALFKIISKFVYKKFE